MRSKFGSYVLVNFSFLFFHSPVELTGLSKSGTGKPALSIRHLDTDGVLAAKIVLN